MERKKGNRLAYDKPSSPEVSIVVDLEEEKTVFSDSGIGMSKNTVGDFLLVAGASFWNSDQYFK